MAKIKKSGDTERRADRAEPHSGDEAHRGELKGARYEGTDVRRQRRGN